MTELRRKKVLLVDDELAFLLTMKRHVLNAGFDVEVASNGREALEKVRKELPDLVVIDAVMPEMNGLETSRQIRALDPEKKIPIIMLTGLKAESDEISAHKSGVTQFLRKPVTGEELVSYILTYLRSTMQF